MKKALLFILLIITINATAEGFFSVAEGRYVYFTPGMLYYTTNSDTIENGEETEIIDHSCWRYSSSPFEMNDTPTNRSKFFFSCNSNAPYGLEEPGEYSASTFIDWGNNIHEDGEEFFTLSAEEWNYLLFNRIMEKQEESILLGLATISLESGIFRGLILLPNHWQDIPEIPFTYYKADKSTNYSSNELSSEQWDKFQEHGAIFLPAWDKQEKIDGTIVYEGLYWTSNISDNSNIAKILHIKNTSVTIDDIEIQSSLPVRLVRKLKYWPTKISEPESKEQATKIFQNGQLFIRKNHQTFSIIGTRIN